MKDSPLSSQDRKRLLFLAIVIFSFFTLLIAQFYRIQVIEGEKWVKEARKQHFFAVKEPYLRGTFFSNTSVKKGHPEKPQRFVVDVEKFHLYIDPSCIPEECRNEISNYLMALLELSVEEQKGLREQFDKQSRSRKLAMWLDDESRETVITWWNPYAREHDIPRNALFFVSDYQRSYPFGKMLGQVLHTVQGQKDEKTHHSLPTGGLEMQFQQVLEGKQGKRRLMRSPANAMETGEVITLPENGADIYLTINHTLQAIAEEEIERAVKKSNGKSGWVVMMDPKTGEILALAQYPFFNPTDYAYYFNDPVMIEHTKVKAITDANEPGSIMKPFSIVIAFMANQELKKRGEKPLFDPEEKMDTANGRFPGRSKPIKDTHFHRFLNMEMAVQKSSNIYVARLIERVINRLGTDWYRSVLHDVLGFGDKTGIELPAESRGLLPTPGKKHPNGAFEWSTPTPFSLAFGHNVQLTSMQIVRAYAMLANGGYRVDPTLVRKIVKTLPDGSQTVLLDNTRPERTKAFPRVLDAENVQKVVRGMKYTSKTGGTARRADIPGYTEAGKTGTSEKIVNGTYSKTINISTFIGFAPVNDPAFVLLVCIDEPEHKYIPGVGKNQMGGTCCAPVFREIGKRSLEYLGITPDDPYGYPVGDPRYKADKADWVKETRRLQEIYETWNK